MRRDQVLVAVKSGWADVLVEINQSTRLHGAKNRRVKLLQLRDVMRGLMKEDYVVSLRRQVRLIEVAYAVIDALVDARLACQIAGDSERLRRTIKRTDELAKAPLNQVALQRPCTAAATEGSLEPASRQPFDEPVEPP